MNARAKNEAADPVAATASSLSDAADPAPATGALAPTWLALASAIFLGACLIFLVQPMLGRFILPWFGGSPAVWTACMLFFQVLLLGGYAYAYGSVRHLSLGGQARLHLALIALSLIVLPITPEAPVGDIAADGPPLARILGLLAVSVGLPYFVLSATSPLLQSWAAALIAWRWSGDLSETGAPRQSPYRLYALANAGSLLALIGYPLVVEPWWGAIDQTHLWSWAYGVFAGLCGLTALVVARRCRSNAAPLAPVARGERAPLGDRVLWVALTAVASVLLLATTHAISQDVSVSPVLWVLPLALYLLSFILCFDNERWADRRIWGPALVLTFAALAWVKTEGYAVSALASIVIHNAALFAGCMVCHGEVVRLKPGPGRLTGFYMATAVGGALGGLFVGLVAPLIFPLYMEQALSMVALVALYAWVLARDPRSWWHRGGPRPEITNDDGSLDLIPPSPQPRRLGWAAFALAGLALFITLGSTVAQRFSGAEVMTRSFFGVLQVKQYRQGNPDEHIVHLLDGRISHGFQYAQPPRSLEPTAYFVRDSGIGQALTRAGQRGPLTVGILGLGVGTLATYGRPGDAFHFYEINPDVIEVAQSHFTYLKDSRAQVDLHLGDGRFLLQHAPADLRFDVLALDAFSGDAVPAHLMTREAFALYRQRLKPGGVLAVNVSNRHLDLTGMVAALAGELGWPVAGVSAKDKTPALGQFVSDWMLLSPDPALIDAIVESAPRASRLAHPPVGKRLVWTDDYAPVWAALDD